MTEESMEFELSPEVRADWETRLENARRYPLTSPPEGRDEPALADALLCGEAPIGAQPDPVTWESLGISASPRDTIEVGELSELGVVDLAAAYRAGSTTPGEVIAHLQERIGSSFPTVDGVLRLMDVSAQIEDSTRRLAEGNPRPLEGIPVGVKDIIDAAGTPVTCGSHLTGDRVATVDSTVVQRLRAAGAIPFAMTATTEFANGSPENPRYGNVLNPWNRERYSGGSSNGSAASVASLKMPLALGTDTGGSVRQPATWCGITGIKPTRSLIPRTGVASLSWTLDHVGLLARSAADVAMALLCVAGPDGFDPLAVPGLDPVAPRGDLRGLRVGVLDGWFTEICAPDVLAAFAETQETFAAAGAELVPVTLDHHTMSLAHLEAFMILYCEAATLHEANQDRFGLMDPSTVERQQRGNITPVIDYLRGMRRRYDVQLHILQAMSDLDVLVCPGMARGAASFAETRNLIFGPGHEVHGVHARNTMVFNYTGFPGVVTPIGLDSENLPVSVQIIARPRQDMLALQTAAAYEALTDHHLRRPPF